jgi:hypothetical protein
MVEPYKMMEQLEIGEAEEKVLDDYFSTWYTITPVSRQMQRNGIDRIFECKRSRSLWTVEYKADKKAAGTGNVFIETVSVSTNGKPGWALSSYAQLLIVYVPSWQIGYVVPMTTVKGLLPEWVERYKVGTSPNEGYETLGILVPIQEFRKYAIRIFSTKKVDNHAIV